MYLKKTQTKQLNRNICFLTIVIIISIKNKVNAIYIKKEFEVQIRNIYRLTDYFLIVLHFLNVLYIAIFIFLYIYV